MLTYMASQNNTFSHVKDMQIMQKKKKPPGHWQHGYRHTVYPYWLTGWEASTKEHVEEIFRWDVCFKLTVVSMSGCVRSFFTVLIILPSFLRITQHSISVSYSWKPHRYLRLVILEPYVLWTLTWNYSKLRMYQYHVFQNGAQIQVLTFEYLLILNKDIST